MRSLFTILFMLLLPGGCSRRDKSISFYYWKTNFTLDSIEKKTLAYNAVHTLYVRYFDIDLRPKAFFPAPVAPITLDSGIRAFQIIPVIYIKNRTFERIDTTRIRSLSRNVFDVVRQISQSQNITTNEIQFDCDWTEKTKNNYFLFIRNYREISKQRISSTIRLHQVKYSAITGIPPVDHGTLMYYNMGNINAGPENSIYEKSIADRYSAYIRSYPLELDIALPIFSWGQKIRDGKVVELLNKINSRHFENDSNFITVKKNWFQAKHPCFRAGYYFEKNDLIKIEKLSSSELEDMAKEINRHSNEKLRNIVFYDLDSSNLIQYEKDIFKKILADIN